MKLWFLGTSSGYPTHERNCSSILIDKDILIECSDGVAQRLQKIKGIKSLHDIKKIIISHGHADHFSGFTMLIWSMWLTKRKNKLKLIGPEHIENGYKLLLKATLTPKLSFNIKFTKVKGDEGKVDDIAYMRTYHSVESYAYKIDNKVCYTGDTKPFDKLIAFAKGCKVLIHECSFTAEEKEQAHMLGHSTSVDAALAAANSEVEKLILIHWPGDKNMGKKLVKEASQIFGGEVILAEDMKTLKI